MTAPVTPAAKTSAVRPVNAATLILMDQTGARPRILMGKRNPRLVFMPGKYVFPGGRVDPSDRSMLAMGALSPRMEQRLMRAAPKLTPQGCRALALAAIRETFEETGILIGTAEFGAPDRSPGGTWDQFVEHGIYPTPDALTFLARAITPPGRPRRFDTRFFVASTAAIAKETSADIGPGSELTELAWVTLDDAARLDLPVITQVIIQELADRVAAGLERETPVPFYLERRGRFIREQL